MRPDKVKITKWLERGELDKRCKTIGDVVADSAELLDRACSTEIIGPVCFKAADGKWYTVVVEAEVVEASQEFVEECQTDDWRNAPTHRPGHCHQCSAKLNSRGRCRDVTCPYSSHPQSWNYQREAQ